MSRNQTIEDVNGWWYSNAADDISAWLAPPHKEQTLTVTVHKEKELERDPENKVTCLKFLDGQDEKSEKPMNVDAWGITQEGTIIDGEREREHQIRDEILRDFILFWRQDVAEMNSRGGVERDPKNKRTWSKFFDERDEKLGKLMNADADPEIKLVNEQDKKCGKPKNVDVDSGNKLSRSKFPDEQDKKWGTPKNVDARWEPTQEDKKKGVTEEDENSNGWIPVTRKKSRKLFNRGSGNRGRRGAVERR